jgi:hypothetical protein
MMPPICEICEMDFDPDEGGALLYFRKTEESRKFERKAEETGMVGHPPNAGWFCGNHVKAAKQLIHLPLDEALRFLKDE